MIASLKLLIYASITIILGFSNDAEPPKHFVDGRDDNSYEYIEINSLKWMTENLRFKVLRSIDVSDLTEDCEGCGEFYSVDDAFTICPDNWRLPTEKEVKSMFKWHKKQKLSVNESLSILLCGRVDNGMHSKTGSQNTFWMNADMVEGHIIHWHTFHNEQELHSHDVVNADRKFPARCVCEIE